MFESRTHVSLLCSVYGNDSQQDDPTSKVSCQICEGYTFSVFRIGGMQRAKPVRVEVNISCLISTSIIESQTFAQLILSISLENIIRVLCEITVTYICSAPTEGDTR